MKCSDLLSAIRGMPALIACSAATAIAAEQKLPLQWFCPLKLYKRSFSVIREDENGSDDIC